MTAKGSAQRPWIGFATLGVVLLVFGADWVFARQPVALVLPQPTYKHPDGKRAGVEAIPTPLTPGAPQRHIWSCTNCGRLLGEGKSPPAVHTCPRCRRRLEFVRDPSGKERPNKSPKAPTAKSELAPQGLVGVNPKQIPPTLRSMETQPRARTDTSAQPRPSAPAENWSTRTLVGVGIVTAGALVLTGAIVLVMRSACAARNSS